MPRYPGLTLRILDGDVRAMGPGKAQLVSLISSTGSISAAARALGMSYRRAWQLVNALNASFKEPVVVTAIGGRYGGGAVVTAFGTQLLKEYNAMENRASAAIDDELRKFARHLKRTSRPRNH